MRTTGLLKEEIVLLFREVCFVQELLLWLGGARDILKLSKNGLTKQHRGAIKQIQKKIIEQ